MLASPTAPSDSLGQTQLLLDVIDALTLQPDFEVFFSRAAAAIRALLEADGSALILLDHSGRTLEYQFFEGEPKHLLAPFAGAKFAARRGTAGQALRERRSIFVSAYAEHPAAMAAFTDTGLRSNLIIPLTVGTQPLGVLAVSWFTRQCDELPEGRLKLAERIANQIAVAVHRRLLEAQLHEMAITDALTGLWSRRGILSYLDERLNTGRRYQRSFAVILIDLDGFKEVNDGGGHGLGDILLSDCAHRLRDATRKGDRLGRLGGDEFLLVAECVDGDIPQLSSRLLQALQVPYTSSHGRGRLTASVGVAYWPPDGADADSLLHRADLAMYEAKHAGGNQSRRYTPAMEGTGNARGLAAAVREALALDKLQLWYQPIVDARTRTVVATEGLLRWTQADGTVISAGAFIESVERHGGDLVHLLGARVLDQAARQLALWQTRHPLLDLHVNVSPRHFLHPRFVSDLKRVIEAYPCAATRMILEITETAALEDVERGSQVMKRCREMGLRVAIDDFGTGYSSLTYLKHLPLDIVKIDRSFVAGLHENADDRDIVGGVIGIAHALKLAVVAEGAEAEAHLDILRQLGCDQVQGYVISRPVPPEQFEHLLKRAPAHESNTNLEAAP